MTREEIRRENARRLAATIGGKTEFARLMGMEGSQVSQLIGPNPTKNIGNSIAPRIERAFGLPSGYLDVDHSEIDDSERSVSQSNVEAGPDIRGQVPLISWVAAGAFCESPENFAPGDAEKWLSCPVPHGKYTYCLRVVGKSMDNGDDGYRDGEIIFVDPDAEAMPGRDAIVRTPNCESTFKRLKQDVDGIYLQALNPRWEPNYFKMPEGSHICGIVIFAGRER